METELESSLFLQTSPCSPASSISDASPSPSSASTPTEEFSFESNVVALPPYWGASNWIANAPVNRLKRTAFSLLRGHDTVPPIKKKVCTQGFNCEWAYDRLNIAQSRNPPSRSDNYHACSGLKNVSLDTMLTVFSFLGANEVLASARTCKKWHSIVFSSRFEPHWKKLYLERYGDCCRCYDYSSEDPAYFHFNVDRDVFAWPLSCGQQIMPTVSDESSTCTLECEAQAQLFAHRLVARHSSPWQFMYRDESLVRHISNILRAIDFTTIYGLSQQHALSSLEPFLLLCNPSEWEDFLVAPRGYPDESHARLNDHANLVRLVRQKLFLGDNTHDFDWVNPLSSRGLFWSDPSAWSRKCPQLFDKGQSCELFSQFLSQYCSTNLSFFESKSMRMVLLVARLRTGNLMGFRYVYKWR